MCRSAVNRTDEANIARLHRFPAGTSERRNGLEEGCYDDGNCSRPVALEGQKSHMALVSSDGVRRICAA